VDPAEWFAEQNGACEPDLLRSMTKTMTDWETSDMAVTLQLARISAGRLVQCQRSVAELDRLCSFASEPASAYLDLDWAADGLIRMCERTGIGDVLALRRAVAGMGRSIPRTEIIPTR
jgi:hypothetical protein